MELIIQDYTVRHASDVVLLQVDLCHGCYMTPG